MRLVTRIILLSLLVTAIALGAVPGYLRGGTWSWLDLPNINQGNSMTSLLNKGMVISGWQTIEQKQVKIAGNKWSIQAIIAKPESQPITLLLSPQIYYLDKPSVEWIDLQGLEKWKTDSHHDLKFTVLDNSLVKAHLFRAWNQQQTVAVVQWYGFPHGGHYGLSEWFWQDQIAQLKHKRVPWVAVCIKIPINPLEEFKLVVPLATSLAQQVQTLLQENIF